jgi:hypothetical protein
MCYTEIRADPVRGRSPVSCTNESVDSFPPCRGIAGGFLATDSLAANRLKRQRNAGRENVMKIREKVEEVKAIPGQIRTAIVLGVAALFVAVIAFVVSVSRGH